MEEQPTQLNFDFDTVKPEVFAESHDELKLNLGEFSGPLDLLLFLIKQEQANIFDIPIAKITDEYLQYVKLMKSLDITVAGDFLVMAATLIEIKSKMLLPREKTDDALEEIDDPRKELVDQLLEHQKFKNAAEMLYTRATVEQAVFPRARIETDDNNGEINASVFDLLNAFQKILARMKEEIQYEIEREEMSMAEMLVHLRQTIATKKSLNLNEFFGEMRSRGELVLAFLATLELVKETVIKLVQEVVFGDIIAKPA